MGVGISDITPENSKFFEMKSNNGAVITQVESDSPGGKAGLKIGDVVTAVDGQEVTDASQLQIAIGAKMSSMEEDRFFLGIETEELTMPFALKVVGNQPFLYSSDFPHEVTNESCKHDLEELMESEEITGDDKAALLYRNAERFYKLPL